MPTADEFRTGLNAMFYEAFRSKRLTVDTNAGEIGAGKFPRVYRWVNNARQSLDLNCVGAHFFN